jgi:hypothetical protein
VSCTVDAPPSTRCPSPPAGFVLLNSRTYRGYHPTAGELAAASTASYDLKMNPDLAAMLGPTVPSAALIAGALDLALQWRAAREASEAWDEYVRQQDGLAWMQALKLVEQVKPLLRIALAQRPALAGKYRGLAEMCEVADSVASKSLATRRKRAKVKEAEAAQAATAAAIEAATAAATDPAVVQPTKKVTVTI